MKTLDLDQDVPENVPLVLREAAQSYDESASELASAWGDRNAGKVWEKFARILERAADSCDIAISKYV